MSTLDYIVHQLSEKSLRVHFSEDVDESKVFYTGFYSLSLISPLTSSLPKITVITPYSSDKRQFELFFDIPFTYDSTYSLIIYDITSVDGNIINNAAHNFKTLVKGGPTVLGAFYSTRRCIDLVFDRPVGTYSAAATAFLGSTSEPMSLVPWSNVIPVNNIRFQIPGLAPSEDNWSISFTDATDVAGNLSSGGIDVSVPSAIPRPLTYAQSSTLQITNSYVTNWDPYLNIANIRTYFNFALDPTSCVYPNIQAYQIHFHVREDDTNYLSGVVAVDLPSLILGLNDFKLVFNAHIVANGVHKTNDLQNQITAPNAVDLPTSEVLLNDIISKYNSHVLSERYHNAKFSGVFPDLVSSPALGDLCTYFNNISPVYDDHIKGVHEQLDTSGSLAGSMSIEYSTSGNNQIDSSESWSVDYRVFSLSPSSEFKVFTSVTSADGGSTTNPLDYTGSFEAKSCFGPLDFSLTYFKNDICVRSKSPSELDLVDQGSDVFPESPGIEIKKGVVSLNSSPQAVFWALQEALVQYDNHRLYQSHVGADLVNTIVIGDMPNISTIIDSVNILLTKFNTHRLEKKYHGLSDPFYLNAAPATDLETARLLLHKIRVAINEHTKNAGLHLGASQTWITSPLNDVLEITTNGYKINSGYRTVVPLSKKIEYPGNSTPSYVIQSESRIDFTGVGRNPSVAAVTAYDAISAYNMTPGFTSDNVIAFFDKPMKQVNLDALCVVGGLIEKDKRWVSDFSLQINVSNMNATTYSLDTSGLSDISGNEVI